MLKSYINTNISIVEYKQFKNCKYVLTYNFKIIKSIIELSSFDVDCSKPVYYYGRLYKSNYDNIVALFKGSYSRNILHNHIIGLSEFFKKKSNWPEFIKYKTLEEVEIPKKVKEKLNSKIRELVKNLNKIK